MAKIPLRSYIQEIEGLIDRGQTDEAIAHCKHILKYYPKHIDTYRMLGKAYLESQRYSEAADVLHRVLSVFPDDFVSQIGMSIIREDEGNLDAAIWHMERTFEVQPANTAVQDELRRLYGRRDGVEPPKVRLTRGALARLYARGELYPQAIAEIRAALAEDPDRVDLEVILAQTYYSSGQKVEATEACSRLVNKLPFCYEANRLLAEILPGTSRSEDAKTYQQRIFALDPYAAYLSPGALNSTQVPDNAVTLDHFDWQPPQENTQQQPEWAKTVGIDLGETEEPLPDWLTPMPTPPPVPSEENISKDTTPTNLNGIQTPFETKEDGNNSQPEDQVIPDWMKTAGWAASAGEGPEVPSVPEGKYEEEIAAADIPDWLQSFAPSENTAQELQSSEEQEKLEKLDKILPPQSAEEAKTDSIPVSSVPEVILPEFGQGITQPETTFPGATQALTDFSSETAPAEALPDWLQGLGTDNNSKEAEINESQQLPDWMQSLNEPFKDSEAGLSESSPDWLTEFAAGQNAPADLSGSPSDELPEWMGPENLEKPVENFSFTELNAVPENELLSEPTEISQEVGPMGSISEGEDVDAAMAWLETLAAKQGADEDTLTTLPEERLDMPPEWVQREMESNTLGSTESPAAEIQTGQEIEIPASVPEKFEQIEPVVNESHVSMPEAILSTETPTVSQEAEPIEPIISETKVSSAEEVKSVETSPAPEANLESIAEIPPVVETSTMEAIPQSDTNLQTEISPEITSESELGSLEMVSQTSIDSQPVQALTEDSQPAVAEEQPEPPAAIEEPSAETVMEEQRPVSKVSQEAGSILPDLSSDDGFAWLEALAAKQGADENTLSVAPEDRSETPPAWLNQETTVPLEETPESNQSAEVNFNTLSDAAYEPISKQSESKEVGLPEWLRSAEFVEQENAQASDHENQSSENSLPDWLKELELEEPAAETGTAPIEETADQPIPDWLQGVNTEEATPSVIEDLQPPEEKQEALHEWLESLENKPEEGFQIPLEEPVTVDQEPLPDWLQGLDETTIPSLELTPDIGKTEEVPTWVNDLDNISGEESKLGYTKPLAFPSESQSVEPEGSFEITPESVGEPEATQPVAILAADLGGLSEVSEPSITDSVHDTILSQAQTALDKGKLKEALEAYNQLISSGRLLDESIHDLRDALYRYPVDIGLWQALGDAYVRGNHIQDALDAYTKAEELLR